MHGEWAEVVEQRAGGSKGDAGPSSLIQSVVRAASILDQFAREPGEWSAQDIVRLTGLNRGTVYRFLQTLVHVGYLVPLPNGRYRPGSKMVAFGQIALRGLSIAELAEPILIRLRDTLQTTINMTVLEGTQIQYVARLRGPSLLDTRLTVGSRLPAYATSQGRAMLALLPDSDVESLLRSTTIQAPTEKTITTIDGILARVRAARRDGFAFVEGEIDLDLQGVAVAIAATDGTPAAAINAAYVRQLRPEEIRDTIFPELRRAADEIGELLASQERGHA